MGLILAIVGVAAVVGLLRGGSLRDFPSVKIRWWWLAAVGLALQIAPVRDPVSLVALLASLVFLIVFAAANIRAPGFILIFVGLALNLAVIGANRGMPVTRAAIVRSSQEGTVVALARDEGGKHRLADEDTVLLPLADVIAVPPPVGAALSAGDVVLYLGIAWFVVLAMRPREEPGPAVANARLA
jgi:uncharacterized protein DUF5317